ncbi:non-ribosomal peptide synthetase [Microlunatus soli]|uniref:Amino acid adenylation domain-containing protein n=1 Tax=Microlunatus soli TaxID=630515 RepID=A0A1H1VSS4_9ACTN|nr:non-ribosomal peptide synthetase [Microlunatus soli]SDS87984.1 amino acid adenylation domain-containing protein [Microlunatus soli]
MTTTLRSGHQADADQATRFRPVHALIDGWATTTPDAPAVTDSECTVSYRQLRAASGRFAAELRAHGVGRGDVVAVHLPRSARLVVTMLAVARIGAASLLLDRSAPAEWLAGFVDRARPAVLVSDDPVLVSDGLGTEFFDGPVLRPQPSDHVRSPDEADEADDADLGPEDLACLVQTSGTTGVPKLVLVPHRTWSYSAQTQRRLHRIDADERGAWLFPAHTNVSASVVVWPFLAAGAQLLIPSEDLLGAPEELARWMRRNRVTQCFAVAALAEALARLDWPPGELWLMLTGSDRVREWGDRGLPFEVGNWYGANEVNIVTSSILPWSDRITSLTARSADRAGPPPIGRFWPGTRHRVLDADGRPVVGSGIGELWVGGEQLALGYLSARQTAEKFLPDPAGPPGSRIYRTGDLVRIRPEPIADRLADGVPDGVLEHCGRCDEQVKINGMRVEMAEVEQRLLSCPGVLEAAAAAVEDGSGRTQLVGYIVRDRAGTADHSDLREQLAGQLPNHMVPVAFVELPELPRNRGDKIDRRALPVPSLDSVPASDRLERRIAEIWAQALGQDSCGAEDNFFLLGGDSLQASRAAALITAEFGTQVEVRDVLTHPTSREFAGIIRRAEAAA